MYDQTNFKQKKIGIYFFLFTYTILFFDNFPLKLLLLYKNILETNQDFHHHNYNKKTKNKNVSKISFSKDYEKIWIVQSLRNNSKF